MRRINIENVIGLLILSTALYICGCKKENKSQIAVSVQNDEVVNLSKQYKNLREKRGHFSGGEWDDDLDRAGGLFETTLISLGQLLGNPSYTKTDIIKIIGEPDAMRQEGENEYLIYFWRGWHDYLFFICKDGVVQKHSWYYAYE